MDKKQGLLVIVCAPSQGGKDFLVGEYMHILNEILIDQNLGHAQRITAYKTREHRNDDPDYIKCVASTNDIPIAPTDQICGMYGDDLIVYNKEEIETAIADGKIVFIASGSPSLCESLKETFGNNSLLMFVRRQQVSAEQMAQTSVKRDLGKNPHTISEIPEKITQKAQQRMDIYKSLKPAYAKLYQNSDGKGADYITRNWFTLLGGPWSSQLSQMGEADLHAAAWEIAKVYKTINDENNKNKDDWRKAYGLVTEKDDRTKNPLSLQEDWFEYRYAKTNCDGAP